MRKYKIEKKHNDFKEININNIFNYVNNKKNEGTNKVVLILYLCNNLEKKHIENGNDILILYLNLLNILQEHLVKFLKRRIITNRKKKCYEKKELEENYTIRINKLQLSFSYIILHISYFLTLNKNYRENYSLQLYIYYLHILTFLYLKKYIFQKEKRINEEILYLCFVNTLLLMLINIYKFKLYEILNEKNFYIVSKYMFAIIYLFSHIKRNGNEKKLVLFFYDYIYNVLIILIDKYYFYLKKKKSTPKKLITFYKYFVIFIYNFVNKLKIFKYIERYLLGNNKSNFYNLTLLSIIKNTIDIHFIPSNFNENDTKKFYILKFKKNLEENTERVLNNERLNRNFEENKIKVTNVNFSKNINSNKILKKKNDLSIEVNYKTVNYIIFLKLLKLEEVLLIRKDRIFLCLYIYYFINKIAYNTIKEVYKFIKKKKIYMYKYIYYRLLFLYEFYFNIIFFIINEVGKEKEKKNKKFGNSYIYFIENSFFYMYEIYMLLIILLSVIPNFYKIFNKNNFSFVKRILYIRKCNNYIFINSITKLICDCFFFSQSLLSLIIFKFLFKNNKKLNNFLLKRVHIYIRRRKFYVVINKNNIYININSCEDEKFKINKNKIKIIQDNNFNKLKILNTNLLFDQEKGFHLCVNSYVKINFLLEEENKINEENNYAGKHFNITIEDDNLDFYKNNIITKVIEQKNKADEKINNKLFENFDSENKIIHNKRCSEKKGESVSEKLANEVKKCNNFNITKYDNKLTIDSNLIFKGSFDKDKDKDKNENEQLEQENYTKIYFLLLMNNFISEIKKKKKYYFVEYNYKNYLNIYVNKLHYYCNNIFNNKSLFRHNISSFIKYNLRKNTNFFENITSFNRKLNYYNKKISEKKNIFKNKIGSLNSAEKKHNTPKYTFLNRILNYKNKYFHNENYYFNFLFNIKFLHNLNDNINEYFLFKKKKKKKKMIFNININLKDKIKKMKHSSSDQYYKSIRSFSLNYNEEKNEKGELLAGNISTNKLHNQQKKIRIKKSILYFLFLNYNYCIFNYEKNEHLQYFLLEILKYFEAIIPYINIYKYICSYLLFIISFIEKKPLENLDIFMINKNLKKKGNTKISKKYENCTNKHINNYQNIFIKNNLNNKKDEENFLKFPENNKFNTIKSNIDNNNYSAYMKSIHEMYNCKNKYSNIFKEKRIFYDKVNINEIMINKLNEKYEYIEKNVIQNMRNLKDRKFYIFHKGNNKMILKILLGINDKIKIYLFSNTFHYLYKSKMKYNKNLSVLSLYFYKLYFTLIYYEIYKEASLNIKEIEMIKGKVIEITPILSIKYINKSNIKNICNSYILENIKENKIHNNVGLNFTDYERLYIFIIYYIESIRKKEDILYCFYLLIDKNIFRNKFLHKNIKKLIKYKIYVFLNELNSFNNYNFINTTFFILMNIMNYNKILRNYIYYIFDQIFKLRLNTLYDNMFLICFLKNLEKSSIDYAFSKILYDEKKTFKNIIDKKKNKMIKIIYKTNLYLTINYLLFLKILNGCKLFLNLYSYFYYEFYIFCFNKYAKQYKYYLIRRNKIYRQTYSNIKKKKSIYFSQNSIDIKEYYEKKSYMYDNKNSLNGSNNIKKKKNIIRNNLINSEDRKENPNLKNNRNINRENYKEYVKNFHKTKSLETLDRNDCKHLTNNENNNKIMQHKYDQAEYYNISSENLFLIHIDEKHSSNEAIYNRKFNFSNKYKHINKKLKKNKKHIFNDNDIKIPKYTMGYSKYLYEKKPYTIFKKYSSYDNYAKILRRKKKSSTYMNASNDFSELFDNYIKNDYYENEAIDNDVNYFKILKKIKGSNTHIYNIYDIKISKKIVYKKKYFKEYLNIINFITCIFLTTNINNLNMSMLNNNYIYIISRIIKKNFKFYFLFFYYNIFKNRNKRYKNVYNANFNIILNSSVRKNFNTSTISIKNKYIYVLYTLSCILSIYDYKYAFFNYYFFFFYKIVKILAKFSLKFISISDFLIDKFSNDRKYIDENNDKNKSEYYINSGYENIETGSYYYIKNEVNEESKTNKENCSSEKIFLNDRYRFLRGISKNKRVRSNFKYQFKEYSNGIKKEKKSKILNKYEKQFIVSDIMMIKNYIKNYIIIENCKIHNNLIHSSITNRNILDQYIKYINNIMIIFIFINYMILMNENMNLSKKKIIKNKLKILEDYKVYLMNKILDIFFLNIPYLCNYLVVILEFFFVFSNSFLSLNCSNYILVKDINFFFKNSYFYFLTNMFNKMQNLKTFYHVNFYKNSNLYFHNFKKSNDENFDFCKNNSSNYVCNDSNYDFEKCEKINKIEEYVSNVKKDEMKVKNQTENEFNEKNVRYRYFYSSPNNSKSSYNILNNDSTCYSMENNNIIKEKKTINKKKNKKEEINSVNNHCSDDSLSEFDEYIYKDAFIELKEILKKQTKEYIKSYFDRKIKNICFFFRCFNDISSICLFLNFYINSNTKINEKYNHICIQSMNNIYLYNFRFLKICYNFISIIFLALIKMFNYTSNFFHSYNHYVQLYSKYKYNYFLYLDDCSNFFTFYNVYNFSVKKSKKKENVVNINKEINVFFINEIFDHNKFLLQKSFIFLAFFFHNFNDIIPDIYCINCSNKYSMGSIDKNASIIDLTKVCDIKKKKNSVIDSNKTDYLRKKSLKYRKEIESENKENVSSYDYMKKDKKYIKNIYNNEKNEDTNEKGYIEILHNDDEKIYKLYDHVKKKKKANNFTDLERNKRIKINNHNYKNNKGNSSNSDTDNNNDNNSLKYANNIYTYIKKKVSNLKKISYNYFPNYSKKNSLKESIKYTYDSETIDEINNDNNNTKKINRLSKANISISEKNNIENDYDTCSLKDKKEDLNILNAYKYMLSYQKTHKKTLYDYNLKEELNCICINKYVYICNLIYNCLIYILEIKCKYKKKKFSIFSYNIFKKKIKQMEQFINHNDKDYIIINTKNLLNLDFIILSILHLLETIYINFYKCKLFTDMCIFNNIKYICLENKGLKKKDCNKFNNTEYVTNNFHYNRNCKDKNDITRLFYFSDCFNSLNSVNSNIYNDENNDNNNNYNNFNIKTYYNKYSNDSINNYCIDSIDNNNNTDDNYNVINDNNIENKCGKVNNSNNIKSYDSSLRSTYDDNNLKRMLSNFKKDKNYENQYKERYSKFLKKNLTSNINFSNDNKKIEKTNKKNNKFFNKIESEYKKKGNNTNIWNEHKYNYGNIQNEERPNFTKNELKYFSSINNILRGFKDDKGNKNKRVENKKREINKRNFFYKKNKDYNISKNLKNLSLSEFFSDKKLMKKEKKELSFNYFKKYKILRDNYKIKFNKKKKSKINNYDNIYKIRRGNINYKKDNWNLGKLYLRKKLNYKNKEIENIRINNLSVSYKSRIIKNKNVNKLLKMNMEKEEENIERIKHLFITFNNNKEKKINNYIQNVFKYISLYSNFNVFYKKKIEILNYKIKVRRRLLKTLYSFYYKHNISLMYKIYKKIEYIYTYLNLLYYNNLFHINLKEMNDEINKYSLFIIAKYLKYHMHNLNNLFNLFIVKIINYINSNIHNITEFLCMYDYSDLLNILNQYIISINISNKLTINKYNLFLLRKNKLLYVPISNILFLYCNNISLNDIIKILYSHPQYTLFLKSVGINNLVYLYKKSTITNTIYLQLFEYLKVDLGNRVFFFIIFFSFHSFKFLYDFFLNMHTYINDEHLFLLGYYNLKKGQSFLLPLNDDKNNIFNKSKDNIENNLLFNKDLFVKKKNAIIDFIITCSKKRSALNKCTIYKNKITNNINISNFIFHKYQNYVKKSDVLSLKCSLIKKIFLDNLNHNKRNVLLESCHLHNIIFCISQKASKLDKNVQNDFVKMEIKNLLNNFDINNLKLLTSNNKVSDISDNIKILMSATRSPIFLTFKTKKSNIKKCIYFHPFIKYSSSEKNEIKNEMKSIHDTTNDCAIDEIINNNKMENIISCDYANDFANKIKCNDINNTEKIKETYNLKNKGIINNIKKEKNNLGTDTSFINIEKNVSNSDNFNEKWIINNVYELEKQTFEDVSYIYKVNDDVRQDKLVIQTIHIFIHILNEYKLFYNLFPYNIVTNKFFNIYSNGDEIEEKKAFSVKEKIYNVNDSTNKKENENKKKISFSFYLFKKKKKKKNLGSCNENKFCKNSDKNNKVKEDMKIVVHSYQVDNMNSNFQEHFKSDFKRMEFSKKEKKKKKKKKFENFGAIIEVLANTKSRHDIGRKFNNIIKFYHLQFSNTNLYIYALKNFISSLAAYSLLSFILQVKDRHNGNLLFDENGNIIHIDFGYILNIYPGISINFELAPFKLTREMIMLLTIKSQKKQYFIFSYIQLVVKGYLLLRKKSDWIISSILSLSHSDINCFKYNTIEKLKKRLRLNKNDNDASIFMINKIHQAYNNITTIMYDYIQNIQQGIK
ncbi:phosphatidylinositol 4-kinase, putative [Plasmodium relictum]|uniref:Phosphatidylinositol 4-kinase, putative n=1 Tax=Plasmodium relictum TaxID=85471 RepID=A0A1J1H243_PLARL|nr:phosphatidylinositol 4-kinase, putative [Plasmodium relictum]CRG98994.1 phosphatidylinositol 4-kinase, putative [Plasmodium relictum]